MNYWLQYTAIGMLLVSYLSSLNAFRLDMPKAYKQFSFFLLFVVLGELFAYAWSNWLYELLGVLPYNQWFYNFFHLLSYSFLMYFFYQVLGLPKVKKIIPVLALVYIAFALINLFFIQGLEELNTRSELVASIILIFLSIAYYYQILLDKKIIPLLNNPLFWISTGVLVSNLGSILALYLINVIAKISMQKADTFLLLIQFAAILTSITFSIAFLCRTKK
jgi:hypothetical protein